MTPLAHRIVKELSLSPRSRTFKDRAGLLSRMGDVHCFEVTEVMPVASELARDMARKAEWLEDTAFLPAPRTWIEFRDAGERFGMLLERRSTACFLTAAQQTGFQSGATPLMFFLGQDAHRNQIERPLSAHTWRTLIALLAMINTPRLIGRKQHMPHRGLERSLLRAKSLVGQFPLKTWTELTLSVSAMLEQADGTVHEAHLTGERCLHFCRAHLRIRNGQLEQVKAHWRGNPALGVKRTRYKLAA